MEKVLDIALLKTYSNDIPEKDTIPLPNDYDQVWFKIKTARSDANLGWLEDQWMRHDGIEERMVHRDNGGYKLYLEDQYIAKELKAFGIKNYEFSVGFTRKSQPYPSPLLEMFDKSKWVSPQDHKSVEE